MELNTYRDEWLFKELDKASSSTLNSVIEHLLETREISRYEYNELEKAQEKSEKIQQLLHMIHVNGRDVAAGIYQIIHREVPEEEPAKSPRHHEQLEKLFAEFGTLLMSGIDGAIEQLFDYRVLNRDECLELQREKNKSEKTRLLLRKLRQRSNPDDLVYLHKAIAINGNEYDQKDPPNKWTQLRLLGRGGGGAVFLCCDDGDKDDLFAVKKINVFDYSQTVPDYVINELTLLRRLRHDNVVKCYGFKEHQGVVNIFMEYMSRGSLADLIHANGPLDESTTEHFTYQILNGLVYLHEEKVVHRDIKGQNILLDEEGNVKLGDFGISVRLITTTQKWTCGHRGTTYYISPEIIRNEKYGRKTDIWSLGCTVVEMLTGHPPFRGYEELAVIFHLGQGDQPPVYTLPEAVSRNVERFLSRCFQYNPKLRASANDLLKDPFIKQT